MWNKGDNSVYRPKAVHYAGLQMPSIRKAFKEEEYRKSPTVFTRWVWELKDIKAHIFKGLWCGQEIEVIL